jgi:hypothetical protein
MSDPAFAVVVTLLKDIPTGHNIQTSLQIFNAASEDEARGRGVAQAMAENPTHMVFTVIVKEITGTVAVRVAPRDVSGGMRGYEAMSYEVWGDNDDETQTCPYCDDVRDREEECALDEDGYCIACARLIDGPPDRREEG